MFSCGSDPEGILIEHRNVTQLVVCEASLARYIPPAASIAHMSNIEFDVATTEIFSALLTGRTLVRIDSLVILDPRKLAEKFMQERVRSAVFSASLLKSAS